MVATRSAAARACVGMIRGPQLADHRDSASVVGSMSRHQKPF